MKVPLILASSLWHVGDLTNNTQGQRPSHEGTLLSASACPNAWSAIARLGGGRYYELHKESMLLDMVKALYSEDYAPLRDTVSTWALQAGYIKPGVMYVVAYEDCEAEDEDSLREMHFLDKDEAATEADFLDATVEIRQVMLPTEPLLALHKINRRDICSNTGSEFSLIEWARVHLYSPTRVAGVYWNEILDEFALSAPRAGLFDTKGLVVRPSLPDDEECLESVSSIEMEIYPRPISHDGDLAPSM